MPRKAVKIVLTPEERKMLEANVKSQRVEKRIFLRSRIVLLAAEGKECIEIAEILSISEKTCRKWRNRFAEERLEGLLDLQRSGAPEVFSEVERQEIVQMACQPPENIANWTLAELTQRVVQRFHRNISVETVRLILKSATGDACKAEGITRLQRRKKIS